MIKINTISHEIQLNFGTSEVKRVKIKQNSNETHILSIRLYDNNNEISIDDSLNITISAVKGDKTHILNSSNISVINNAINVTMTQQMLSASGTEKCELIIQDGVEILYSETFLIYVEPNVQDGSFLESFNECDVIVETLNKVSGHEREAKNKKDEINQIALDVTDTKENIDETYADLQQAVTQTNNLIEANETINANEVERIAAENTRVENESTRQTNMINAIEDAEAATERANNAAEECEGIVDGTGLVKSSEKGQANGVAELDETGVIKKEQLPTIDEATSASKLQNTTAIGHSTRPVYFSTEGVPVPINYTLQSACARHVADSVSSGSPYLPTSGAVFSALSKKASYEEGAWIPHLMNNDLLESAGNYTRIENLCFLQGAIRLSKDIRGTLVFDNPPFYPYDSFRSFEGSNYGFTGTGKYCILGRYKSSTGIGHSINDAGVIQGDVEATGSYFTLCPDGEEYGRNDELFAKANTYIEFNLLYTLE